MTEPDATCEWCGDPIEDGEERVIVCTADSTRFKVDPSFPDAQFHTDTCYSEASRYGWVK